MSSRLWFAFIALVLTSSTASAQGIAHSFDQLQLLVRPGDTLIVRDAQGTETSGRVKALSQTTLTLSAQTFTRDFRETDVNVIRQRLSDPLANGALWGLVIGGALAVVPVVACNAMGDCGPAAAVFIPIYAGIGAGIGVGFDALISRPQVIFEKPGSATRLRTAPLLGAGRRGVQLSLFF